MRIELDTLDRDLVLATELLMKDHLGAWRQHRERPIRIITNNPQRMMDVHFEDLESMDHLPDKFREIRDSMPEHWVGYCMVRTADGESHASVYVDDNRLFLDAYQTLVHELVHAKGGRTISHNHNFRRCMARAAGMTEHLYVAAGGAASDWFSYTMDGIFRYRAGTPTPPQQLKEDYQTGIGRVSA